MSEWTHVTGPTVSITVPVEESGRFIQTARAVGISITAHHGMEHVPAESINDAGDSYCAICFEILEDE